MSLEETSLKEMSLKETSRNRQRTTSLLTQSPTVGSDVEMKGTVVESAIVKPTATQTAEGIEQWMVDYLAEMLEISADEIEADVPFDTYGLDSSAAVGLTGDLEDWLGQEIEPTILYDYPTVESLAIYLSDNQKEVSYDNN